MQRSPLLIIPGLIVLALYAGLSNIDRLRGTDDTEISGSTLDFDAYAEGINTISFDLSGNIDYTLQAVSQIHFNDDVTELERPLIKLYRQSGSHWNIVADSGRISPASTDNEENTRQIELAGNVEVYSFDEFGNRVVMASNYLILDPQLETLMTEEIVTFTSMNIEQTARGMFADLNLDEIQFSEDGRGHYVPTAN